MLLLKKYFPIFILAAVMSGCTKSDFEKSYTDPAKIATSSISRQFEGILNADIGSVLPNYTSYFVICRSTLNRYSQATGWLNENNQYAPGAAAVQTRWDNSYNLLAQYREFQQIYAAQSQSDRDSNRIYMIAATTYFYDQSQRLVDLFGDIPWSAAGMLHAYGGDYEKAKPAYDDAATIYTTMLDTLKSFANELGALKVNAGIMIGFKTQDIINGGSVALWRKYCNSLRLRMLTRVADVPALASRSALEIKSILDDQATYPLITTYTDNAQIDVFNVSTPINTTGVKDAMEAGGTYYANLAPKAMIDLMKQTSDPRLKVMFEPGANAGGVYTGLDPLLNASDQTALALDGKIAIYNRSTYSRNQLFPGVLINAGEVQFLMAENYLKNTDDGNAKTAYENGIKAAIDYIYKIRAVSTNNDAGAVTPYTVSDVNTYLANPAISWSNATTTAQKTQLIATQKWILFNVIQPYENWAEFRRLDLPFAFLTDNSSAQTQPPYRWYYPNSEKLYNADNYAAVASKDLLTVKIFWDVH